MNTGRMRELLLPGAELFLSESENPARKTRFDLVAVRRGDEIVNIDSLAPNKVAAEYIPTLFPGAALVRPETFYGKSRFDFYVETPKEKIFLEVKGVTLDCGGEARFPDAPTERGCKHLRELQAAVEAGFGAWVLFVIQMADIRRFEPNWPRDPEFAKTLCRAAEHGVRVRAVECAVTADSLEITKEVPVFLG